MVPDLRCLTTHWLVQYKVLSGAGYTQKADLWSAGVIAFILLSGSFPFLKDEADLNDQVRFCFLSAVNRDMVGNAQ